MPEFGRPNETSFKQMQALSHPLRVAIMALFTRETKRSLQAEALAADLATDFPDVKVKQVWYHVAVLRDADLIPAA